MIYLDQPYASTRSRAVAVAAACAWLVATAPAHARALGWEAIGGMYGGGVDEVAAIPGGALLARVAGDVWRSPNRGETWTPTGGNTERWVVVGATAYGVSPDGVLASHDGGETWRPTGLDGPLRALATSDDAVYALTETQVLRFDGDAWREAGDVAGLEALSALAVAGEHVFVARQAPWTEDAVTTMWRLSPGDDTWTPVLQNQDMIDGVDALTAADGRILVGRPVRSILWSDDLGKTWNSDGGPAFANTFAADDGFVYTTGEWSFMRSEDGGLTWPGGVAVWTWEPFLASRASRVDGTLAAADGYVYAATSRSGLYRARHGQEDWDLVGVAQHRAPKRMVASGSHVMARAGAEAFLVADTESRWRRSERSSALLGGMAADGSALYSAAYSEDALARSVDGGRTWQPLGAGPVVGVCAVNGRVYAGAAQLAFTAAPRKALRIGFGIRRSDDGGDTWIDMSDGLPEFFDVFEIAGAGSSVLAWGGHGDEWYAWRGDTWRPAPAVPGRVVRGVGAWFYAATEDGIVRSRDGGDTWEAFAEGLAGVSVESIVALSGGLYVGSADGVHTSPDDGLHWRPLAGGLHGKHVVSLATSRANMYAGIAGGGVARAPLPDVVAGVDASGRRHVEWARLKADAPAVEPYGPLASYPNPFNPETWIPYRLAEAADVSIVIRDAGGNITRRLAVGRREAGRYTTRSQAAHWDGRNDAGEGASSGVYFVTLRAGSLVSTHRITLTK